MKKSIILGVLLFVVFTTNAQRGYYISLGAGPSYMANQKLLSTSEGALKGSYGEGKQIQLRGGYFFNEHIGIDLGIGYLHGEDQLIRNDYLKISGRARAIGAALTGVYNLSQNVYFRGGLLTKIGGNSLSEGTIDIDIPGEWVDPRLAGSGQTLPLHVEFDRDSKGKVPLGFVGAFGCKFKLSDHWGIFAEMEYQGIDVTPDNSKLTRYYGTLAGQPVDRDQLLTLIASNPQASYLFREDKLSIYDEFTYSDNPADNQRKTFDVPYSSFGFTFGVTYFF